MKLLRLASTALGIGLLLACPTAAWAGDGFRVTIERQLGLECGDCDGLAIGDINGNGKMDLLASSGKGGTAFWFEQGDTPWDWTRHTIFTISDRPREIEGNDLGDFNGDGRLEAISLDQPNGNIYLHKAKGDPRGEWHSVLLLAGRPYVQASLVADVDGDGRHDLIYTWEGDAPGRGGVHWLKLTGTDVLDPAHWTDHVMVAWSASQPPVERQSGSLRRPARRNPHAGQSPQPRSTASIRVHRRGLPSQSSAAHRLRPPDGRPHRAMGPRRRRPNRGDHPRFRPGSESPMDCQVRRPRRIAVSDGEVV